MASGKGLGAGKDNFLISRSDSGSVAKTPGARPTRVRRSDHLFLKVKGGQGETLGGVVGGIDAGSIEGGSFMVSQARREGGEISASRNDPYFFLGIPVIGEGWPDLNRQRARVRGLWMMLRPGRGRI